MAEMASETLINILCNTYLKHWTPAEQRITAGILI